MKKILQVLSAFVLIILISGLNRINAGITRQPMSVTECETKSTITITFSVVATCKITCTYQWQAYNKSTRSWENLVNHSSPGTPKIAGVTTSQLQLTFGPDYTYLTTAYNGTKVRCIVSGETSNEATLTVLSRVSISEHPSSTAVVVGQPVTFTVTASGSNLSYQWRKDAVNISGATSSSYTIASVALTDAGTYTCVVSNTCNSLTSTGAVLTVYSLLTITKQPSNQSGCEGSAGVTYTISVTGPSPTFQWQWYHPKFNPTWTDIPAGSGGTNQNLVISTALTSSMNGNMYRCVINASGGQSVTSSSASLTVILLPWISSQPVGATKLVGESVTFNIGAGGSNLSYQWQKNSVNISGATSSSYTIVSVELSDAGTYRCIVKNSCNPTGITSNGAVLTVNASPKYAWFLQNDAGDDLDVKEISAISSSVAWAVLNGTDKLIKTTNGGTNWTSASTGTSYYWQCIEFVNANLGFVGGYNMISKYNGSTWTLYNIKDSIILSGTLYPTVYKIHFVTSSIGYAVGSNGLIIKTSNGGNTWVKLNWGSDEVKVTAVDLRGVHFTDATHGFVVGLNGKILRTTDGAIWTELTSPTTNPLYDVHFVSNTKGFVTSPSYTNNLFKTENSGDTWTPVTGFDLIYPYEIEFADANNGYMAGFYNISATQYGRIMKTKDGGATWVTQKMEGNNVVWCLDMVDLNNGYAGGKVGQIHHTYYGGCVTPTVSLYDDKTFCAGETYQLIADTVSRNWAPGMTYLWSPGGSTEGRLTVNTTGTYSVTLTNECNVTASDAANITFTPLPETNAGSDVSICQDDSVQLTGSGEGTYSWNNAVYLNNPNVPNPIAKPPVGQTTFTLTVTDAAGCSKSDDVKVTVNAPPSSDFTAPSFLCGTGAGTFTYNGSTSGKTFIWDFDGGSPATGTSSSHSVSWNTLGNKVVSLVTTQNSCSSDPVIKIVNVREMPTSTFDLPNSTCGSRPVTIIYTGTAPSDATYTWGLNGGTITEGSGQGPLQVAWATPGTKNVSLSVTQNGCISGITNESIIAAFPYEGEKICLISVDVTTGKNMIIWERTKNVGIKSYVVHRETAVAGTYEPLDTIPFDSLSVFVDVTSEPESKSQKYRISVIDTCNNESSTSEWHRPMLLTSSVGTGGNSVNLAWTEYEKQSGKLQFASYIIYRGTSKTALTPIDTIPADNTLFVDNTAPKGVDLYYRIAGVKPTACVPLVLIGGKKTQSGPFVHSVSNLEDNRLQATSVNELIANDIGLSVYPNPFNDLANIRYTLVNPSEVVIEVFNVIGTKVKVLLNEKQGPGSYQYELRSSDVDYMTGLYYLKFHVNRTVIVKKLMLNR